MCDFAFCSHCFFYPLLISFGSTLLVISCVFSSHSMHFSTALLCRTSFQKHFPISTEALTTLGVANGRPAVQSRAVEWSNFENGFTAPNAKTKTTKQQPTHTSTVWSDKKKWHGEVRNRSVPGIYERGLSFFALNKAKSETPATFTTLNRTYGISPLE